MGRGSPALILWFRNQHRDQLTFNVFGSTVSHLFTASKVRRFYQILNSLPLFVSLMMILPVSHQPGCSKTVTSRKEALIQITNLRKDAFITEVYRCELRKRKHHTPPANPNPSPTRSGTHSRSGSINSHPLPVRFMALVVLIAFIY